MALADQIRTIRTYAAQGKSRAEIAALVGVEIGDIETVLNTVTMPSAPLAPAARIVARPFAFDTPGLSDGAPLYVPAPGDLLLDAWVEIVTPWNGTTPLGDIAVAAPVGEGLYFTAAQYGSFPDGSPALLDMTTPPQSALGMAVQGLASVAQTFGFCSTQYWDTPNTPGKLTWNGQAVGVLASGSVSRGLQGLLPGRFVDATPMKLWVTQDGIAGNASPGSTQGEASLFLVVATPASN